MLLQQHLSLCVWQLNCVCQNYVEDIRQVSSYFTECRKKIKTINSLNFLHGIIQLPNLVLSIIIFTDIKIKSWLTNSIDPGQTLICYHLIFCSFLCCTALWKVYRYLIEDLNIARVARSFTTVGRCHHWVTKYNTELKTTTAI